MSDADDTLKPPAPPVMIGEPFRKGKENRWHAMYRCGCGADFEAQLKSIRTGNTKSCGCLQKARTVARNRKHDGSYTRIYETWMHIIQRCTNQNAKDYPRYGGRGITMCAEWLESFETFRDWSLGNGYAENMTIDRFPNNDGPYSPENCRWATASEQGRNKRNNRFLIVNGQSKLLIEWAKETGIDFQVIRHRLKLGWSPERAVSEPVRGKGKL